MIRRHVALSAILLPFGALVACSSPPELHGTVNDIWGQPLAGAQVHIEGVTETATSDAAGAFVFKTVPEGQRRIMAGKPGYIKDVNDILVPPGVKEENMPKPTLSLYVEPERPGFYLVGKERQGASGYHHLEAVNIETVGTELGGLSGLPREGSALATGGQQVRFVFSSTLRSSQLSQMNLQLHRLEFVPKDTMTGVLGDTDVKVNLWVAKELIEFDLTGLPSDDDDDYLIVSRDKLKPGIYAFDTEDVLIARDKDALDKTPKEMRVAYPFEVK